jgi:hypothetical protein
MEGIDGSMDMLVIYVIYDLATEKIDAFPAKSKNADETHTALQNFRGTTYVDVVCSDNAREIKQAIRWLGFAHRTSIPGIPANSAIAETRLKIVVYGMRTALVPACGILAVLRAPLLLRSHDTQSRRGIGIRKAIA